MNFKIKRLKIFLAAVIFTVFVLPSALFSQNNGSGPDIETKIAVEKSLEDRLKNILVKIIGSDQILVIISAQLYSGDEKKEAAEEAVIMPGVPVKESLSRRELSAMDTRTMVRNLNATIILDKSISDEVIEVVKEVASGILGIQQERGDSLVIQKMDFRTNPFYWKALFQPPHLWWLILTLSGVVFAFGISLFLFGPFSTILQKLLNKVGLKSEDTPMEFSRHGTLSVSSPGGPSNKIEEKEEYRLFNFIRRTGKDKLSFLFASLTAKQIATILNYQPPEEAAELMELIDKSKSSEVAGILSSPNELTPGEVKELDEKVKNKLKYTVGGESYVQDVISMMDQNTRAEVLEGINSRDAELAGRIKDKVVEPERIMDLDKSKLYEFYRGVGAENFAVFITSVDEKDREELFSKLPGGLAERLRQEVELTGDPGGIRRRQSLRAAIPELKRLLAK